MPAGVEHRWRSTSAVAPARVIAGSMPAGVEHKVLVADRHEARLAEAHLAAVAHEDVEAEHADEENAGDDERAHQPGRHDPRQQGEYGDGGDAEDERYSVYWKVNNKSA